VTFPAMDDVLSTDEEGTCSDIQSPKLAPSS
jgi:hypothetical protein